MWVDEGWCGSVWPTTSVPVFVQGLGKLGGSNGCGIQMRWVLGFGCRTQGLWISNKASGPSLKVGTSKI